MLKKWPSVAIVIWSGYLFWICVKFYSFLSFTTNVKCPSLFRDEWGCNFCYGQHRTEMKPEFLFDFEWNNTQQHPIMIMIWTFKINHDIIDGMNGRWNALLYFCIRIVLCFCFSAGVELVLQPTILFLVKCESYASY